MDGNGYTEFELPDHKAGKSPKKEEPKNRFFDPQSIGRFASSLFNKEPVQKQEASRMTGTKDYPFNTGFEPVTYGRKNEIIPPSYTPLETYENLFQGNARQEDMQQLLKMLLGETEGRRSGYEFFPSAAERKELVTICGRVAEYLHDNHIANLVLLDRSARPAYIGIREMWKQKYPDQPLPGIYFVNPTGFNSTEETRGSRVREIIDDSAWKGTDIGSARDIRSEDEIQKDFQQTYQRLLANKDKGTLLFDTCVHSGDSFKPVLETFKSMDFKNLKVGVVGDDMNMSNIKPDLVAVSGQPLGVCYPFDRDRMIGRRLDSVTSARNTNSSEREKSVRLRKEITKIFAESQHETASPKPKSVAHHSTY